MKKILLTYLTIYSFFLQTTNIAFAKPATRHLTRKNNKTKKRTIKRLNSSENKKTETNIKIENSKITKTQETVSEKKANLSCEEKYNICMFSSVDVCNSK